jgi:hypothetical protein
LLKVALNIINPFVEMWENKFKKWFYSIIYSLLSSDNKWESCITLEKTTVLLSTRHWQTSHFKTQHKILYSEILLSSYTTDENT